MSMEAMLVWGAVGVLIGLLLHCWGIRRYSERQLEAAQQELMKLYAVGLSGCAVPRDFWFRSIERMVAAHVIHAEVTEEEVGEE